MKPFIFHKFVAVAAMSSLTAFAEPCPYSGGGSAPPPPAPVAKVRRPSPRPNRAQAAPAPAAPAPAAPALLAAPAPKATPAAPPLPEPQIAVVPSPAVGGDKSRVPEAPSVPGLELTVVENVPVKPAAEAPPVDTADVAGQIERLAGGAMKAIGEGKPSGDGAATLNSTLKSLIGTWLAVARHGDGELGTVELQLDKDGWAKLTTPGADGKPESVKRRVELKGKELKLTGGESDVNLGTIMNFNEHQLTLAMANDQVTFVRP